MNIQKITPHSTEVSPDAEIFYIHDHMPPPMDQFCQFTSLNAAKSSLFNKNTYLTMFDTAGINIEEKFFVFDGYIYLEDFFNKPNVIFLQKGVAQEVTNLYNNGYDWMFGRSINTKNKTVNFNCPIHKPRPNRVITSCWLYNHCKDQINFNYTQSWDSCENESLLFELLQLAGPASWEGCIFEIKNLDKNLITDNQLDFVRFSNHQQYREIIDSSAVSIVLGVNFWENGATIDEKYGSAVGGGTIPLCDGYGFYDAVKAMGYDIFDDIIDTSYQYEPNPCLRSWLMLEKNKNLLKNGLDHIQQPGMQERLQHNYNLYSHLNRHLTTSLENLNNQEAVEQYLNKYQHIFKSFDRKWPIIEL